MANPQREHGHVDIANDIVEHLAKVNLSPYEWRVLMCILRKTYGWQKKTDFIVLSQIAVMTGLAKSNICRAKKKLLSRNILRKSGGNLGLQKDYDRWIVTSLGNVINSDNGIISRDNKSLSVQRPTIETIKTTTQKKIFRPNSDEFRLAELLLTLILERKPDFKKPDLQRWAVQIDRMIRLDGRKPDRIEAVIRWCQADPFWQSNILSTEKLREKFDQLEFKMKRRKDGSGCQVRGSGATVSAGFPDNVR